ncbi:MAG: fibronectin type III domain-containing protein, partial [Burkholderiales bacterium]
VRAIARDVSGNTTTSADINIRLIAQDTVVPLISGIAAESVGASTATIKWATDELVQKRVEFGTGDTYDRMTAIDLDYSSGHEVKLEGLEAGKVYHYRVRSRDYAGNIATSEDYTFTTVNSAPVGGAVAIDWIDAANAASDGGTLRGTGCDTCGESGAASSQHINGEGYLEFTATVENGLRYIGLADNNEGNTFSDIDFGLRLQGSTMEVRENGIYRWDLGFNAGDVFRISVDNGRVTYARNGTVFYTSSGTPAALLRADAAFYSMSTVSAAKIATSTPSTDVTWTNLVNVSLNGDVLQKTGTCDGCPDAGAASVQQITRGNGYVEFPVTVEHGKLRSIGLTNVSDGPEIAWGLSMSGNAVEVREHRTYRSDTTVVDGDVLRVTVEDGVVSYAKNGVAFYTSTVRATATVRAVALFYSTGGSIKGAVVRAQ